MAAGSDRCLLKTPFVFGVSEWELFWTLSAGAGLVVAGASEHRDVPAMMRLIRRFNVTHACLLPSQLNAFVTVAGRKLRTEPPYAPVIPYNNE